MPQIKWDGAEEPTINNFFKIDIRKFGICSLKFRSTIEDQPQFRIAFSGYT